MSDHGDLNIGDTLDFKFTTVDSTGAPTTLAGSPALAAYPDNSTSEITAGITLTADFDGVTGLNHVRIVATSGNTYASGKNYDVVITAGSVGSQTVVGYVVGSFSIEKRSALRPTTTGRTLNVDSGGVADASLAKILGTAFSEGAAGRIAAAFQALLNIASPVFTVASVNQTGDSYARLGAPAGASIAADLAEIEAETDDIATLTSRIPGTIQPQTGDSYARLGAPAGASVSADIAAIKSDTGNLVNRLGAFTGSGVNTVLGFLKAIMSKTASTPSDVGGTFDASTDSLEAIEDIGVTSSGDSPGVTTLLTEVASLQTDTTALLDRLGPFNGTGINHVFGWLRAIMRKDPGLTPTAVNVGATEPYDNTTDSLQALEDDQPFIVT